LQNAEPPQLIVAAVPLMTGRTAPPRHAQRNEDDRIMADQGRLSHHRETFDAADALSRDNAGALSPATRRTTLRRMLSSLAGLSLLSGLIVTSAMAAGEPDHGPAIVNVVTFTVPPAGMARFLRISEDNSRTSVKEEPGCLGFDVLRPEGEPDKVMLIETYRDEAAYKAHRVTPHFLAFVKGAQEIGAQRTAQVATRYFHGGDASYSG
jgi:autoinducer 2-degrading protein